MWVVQQAPVVPLHSVVKLCKVSKIQSMKKLSNYKWAIGGSLLGALGGYLYWKEIGCLTGTCPLKSHWQTMIPYGALTGYLVAELIKSMIYRHANN
jgi:hypothetical protein